MNLPESAALSARALAAQPTEESRTKSHTWSAAQKEFDP
jgi:hypothetical protein